MSSWLLLLQFPLLYLPLVVVGLVVYGSDFDALPGQLFLGMFFALAVLDYVLGARLERRAVGIPATCLLLLGALAAGVAYRPLHLAYWDEHSVSQAAAFVGLGLFSWCASRIGAGRLRRLPKAGRSTLMGALLALGGAWWSAALFPMMPTLILGAILATGAALGPLKEEKAPEIARALVIPDPLWAWGVVLLGIDGWICVWDYQWVVEWPEQLLFFFVATALGLLPTRRVGSVLLLLGALSFVFAALVGWWGIEPAHTIFAGMALGALMRRVLADDAITEWGAPPFGRIAFFWPLGLALGNAFLQNRDFAAWRLLLLVPPLAIAWRASRRRQQ